MSLYYMLRKCLCVNNGVEFLRWALYERCRMHCNKTSRWLVNIIISKVDYKCVWCVFFFSSYIYIEFKSWVWILFFKQVKSCCELFILNFIYYFYITYVFVSYRIVGFITLHLFVIYLLRFIKWNELKNKNKKKF
jgi:hypothetical protein